jgi:hypothetical protein
VPVDRSPKANMIRTDFASLQAARDRATERGRLELPWGQGAGAARVVVDWGVVPAHDSQRCAALEAR